MKLKAIVCTTASLMLFMISAQAIAQQDQAARDVLDAMSSKYREIPAFSADFTYALENQQESLNEQFNGKITVKGIRYRLDLEGQEVINDGNSIWTYLAEANEVTINTYNPEESEINLNNIFDLYKSGYKYLLMNELSTPTTHVVDLVPEDKNLNYFKIRMEISKNGNELKSFKIFDKSGNRYTYSIDSFKEHTELDDKVFAFDMAAHKGVEVIDFR